jgi:hypothetical protein
MSDAKNSSSDVIHLDLDEAGRALLADWKYINERQNANAWIEFAGHYVAVHEMQVLGHGPDPLMLRAEVAARTGLSPNRIAITYVHPAIES